MGSGGCFEATPLRPELSGLVLIADGLISTTSEEAAVLQMPKLFLPGDDAADVVEAMREAFKLVPQPKEYVTLSARSHGTDLFRSAEKNDLRDLLVAFLDGLQ